MVSGCIEDLLIIGQKLHKVINSNEDDDGSPESNSLIECD